MNPLRTPGPDKAPLLASAAAAVAARQVALTFDDNRLASLLFGQYGQNLALVERKLGVVTEQRGNHLMIDGAREATWNDCWLGVAMTVNAVGMSLTSTLAL